MPILSLQQARNLHLAAQGLLVSPRGRARRAALLAAIERMRLLQIDTINVVARSPYLVLFSRLGDYPLQWLDDLLACGEIFECWAHEACFAPMRDLGLHRNEAGLRSGHWAHKNAARMYAEQREAMDNLLAHVREHGEVKASDFESAQKRKAGWWGWKDEKRWLEAWFVLGEFMISRREKFQRVYDLSERVLAKAKYEVSDRSFRADEIRREFVLGGARALGVTRAPWIADYFRYGKKLRDADLDEYVAAGELIRVDVRGWDAPGYVHADHADLLARAEKGVLRATHTSLLSPFDPVVWDRERASTLFDFDYSIECYTPAPKRRFGYFVLPILHRGRLIGRLDAKAHRAIGQFDIKAIFLEPSTKITAQLTEEVAQAIQRAANWHQTPSVTVAQSDPREFAQPLRAALKAFTA
jgi:uncharacterized protein YcaQ